MNESILTSIKELLGIGEDDTSFDGSIVLGINTSLTRLRTLGFGPEEGFSISDKDAVWSDLLSDSLIRQDVKTYIHLKVKLLFDPASVPASIVAAMNEQIKELEFLIMNGV